MRSFLGLTALVMWVAVLSGYAPEATRPDGFAIYLVKGAPAGLGMDLNRLELDSTPFLSLDDIVSYTWETHAIELTGAARQRVAQLEVPVTTGMPFVVCVGSERIYSGAFWVSYSSMSYAGIVIDTLPAQMNDPTLHLQWGYPASPELFTGKDPRSDPRIRESLQETGKFRL